MSLSTKEEAKSHSKEFELTSYPSIIGSTNVIHVIIKECIYQVRRADLWHKMNKAACTYNVVTNHKRHILTSTKVISTPGTLCLCVA